MSRKKSRAWKGFLGKLMKEHLALRQSIGRVSAADETTLYQLNIFISKKYPTVKKMSKEIVVNFLKTKKNATDYGRRNVVIHIRQFCLFLRRRDVGNYSPHNDLMPKLQYKIQYVSLKQQDILNLMADARNTRKRVPLGGETIAIMIGTLWCTGLRRQELLSLKHSDVDFKEQTLFIRLSKFRKSRVVPMSNSTTKVLQKFTEEKQKYGIGTDDDSPFFSTETGRKMSKTLFAAIFRSCVKKLEIKSTDGIYATPHDLRHNFATRTLNKFYECPEKLPPQVYLYVLSTFLGHADLVYSQYYLHPDFSLLEKASQKMKHLPVGIK